MTIKINTSGAAFTTWSDDVENENYVMVEEVSRILKKIISKLEDGYTEGVEMDINGNKVCTWKI